MVAETFGSRISVVDDHADDLPAACFPAFPRLLGIATGLDRLDAQGKGDLARQLTRLGMRINPSLSVSFGHRFLMRLEDLAVAGIPLDSLTPDLVSIVDFPDEGPVPVAPVGGVALPCSVSERFGRHALVDIDPSDPLDDTNAFHSVRLCVGAFHEFFHTVQELLTGSERQRLAVLLPEPQDLPLFERAAEAFGLWVLTTASPDDLPVTMTDRLAWTRHLIAASNAAGMYHPELEASFRRLDWFMGEAADHIRTVHPAPGSILPADVALRALGALAEEPVFKAVFDGSLFAERQAGAIDYRAPGSPMPPATIPVFDRLLHRDVEAARQKRIIYDTGLGGGDPRIRVEQTGKGEWRMQDALGVSYHTTLHDAVEQGMRDVAVAHARLTAGAAP